MAVATGVSPSSARDIDFNLFEVLDTASLTSASGSPQHDREVFSMPC